ncbi:hypothetical protein HDU90_008849 [Geranomyces variabilis]|nr:hypothetical protein HDU90_008849 [Geranomyces variabilis]
MPSSLSGGYFPVHQHQPSSSVAAPFLLKPHANGTRTLLTHLHFCVELYPDDAKDKVFLAIVKALLRGGNRPCTPKELSNLILKHKLTTLGGATPYATVSSRISQHFRRATDLNRSPLLGRRSLDNKKSRRLVYYVDQVGVPVNPGDDRPHSDSEDSAGEGGETSGPMVSSPIVSPAISDPPVSANPSDGGRLLSNSSNDSGGAAADPNTPIRVSTRVKRRRSPYSPSDEPLNQSKRSRSNSISQQGDTYPSQSRRGSGQAWSSPSRADGQRAFTLELSDNESDDDDISLRRRGQAHQHSSASPHISLTHQQPLTTQPQSPEFAFRPRTTSDDIVLHPITSPQMRIPATATLPSQLSPSQPALDFEVSKEFLPSPFLEAGLDPLEADSCYATEVPPPSSYRMDPALSTFDGAGLGVYHDFHHPENVSVSELDFLLGDGGDDGWGMSSTALPPLTKRVMQSEPETFNRDPKRRKVDGASQASEPTSQHGDSVTDLPAPVSTVATASAAPVKAPSSTESQSAVMEGDRLSTPPPTLCEQAPPPASIVNSPSTSESATHETLSHELSPVSVSSYRCNGDTLEVYEKVARYSIAVRASKIKTAPRLDLLLRVRSIDASGRLVPKHTESSEVRVGAYMEGFVRVRELFELGTKRVPADSNADEVPIKAEEGEPQGTDDESVWAAYVDELQKRTLGSRNGNESVALRICGVGSESEAGFVLVELRGSDVEGDVGVPVECGGVWIPTPEARRLAGALGVSDRLTDLFSSGSDSISDFKPLPSVLTLTSSKFQSLLSAPIRPSTLSLPSPASTPSVKIGDKAMEASLATAGLDEEVKHDDFLDFDAHAEWSQEESGAGESGDDSKGSMRAARTETIPPSQPPVSLDPSTLHLVPPIQPVTGGGPVYMTNIDGILCYVMWLVKGADGNFVGTPAKELPNPLEKVVAPAKDSSAASAVVATSGSSASSTIAPASASSATIPKPGTNPPVPLLRRVDNNMVNATLLLHAGGLVTDKDRSIVLSLERGRARCRKKGSGLYGTWIPLNRARHLARTFCLQGKLGGFLGDGVSKAAFGITDSTVPSTPAVEQVIGSDGTVIYKAAESPAIAGSASSVAANKAALLGLTSLPPNVATGLANINNDAGSVRGLLASARGRGRGKLPTTPLANTPIPGRSLVGGRVGTAVYTPASTAPTSMPATSGPSTAPAAPTGLAGMSNSAAMAATQAAIAALTKLGGSGPLTAATLATALAALNQVTPGGKPGTGAPPMPTAGAASIPSPASILQAFATVFKNGFPTNWKPATTTSSPLAASTFASNSSTPAVNSPLGAKPNAPSFTPLAPSSSSSASSAPGPSSAPALTAASQPSSAPGVVARALAAASAGRGTGLNKSAISSPVSIQTHALYGLPLPSNLSNVSTTLGGASSSAPASSASSAPIAPFPPASSLAQPVNKVPTSAAPTGNSTTPAPTLQPLTDGSTIGVSGGIAVPFVPNVPIIALDDIDGPIASSTAGVAAPTTAGAPLPTSYANTIAGQAMNVPGSSEAAVAQLPAGMTASSFGVIQLPAGGDIANYLEDEEGDELDDIEAIQEDSDDDEMGYEGEEYEEEDADDSFASASAESPLALPGTGGKAAPPAPRLGGGKIRPSAVVPAAGAATPTKTRGKARSKAIAKRQPAKRKAPVSGTGSQNANAASAATPKGRAPTAKAKKAAAAANAAVVPSGKGKGKGKGTGTTTTTATAAGAESEGSDFEIDVCDGDGVDDFR